MKKGLKSVWRLFRHSALPSLNIHTKKLRVNLTCVSALAVSLFSMHTFAQTNLALNKPVTASSTESATHSARNAVDGSMSTRWSSSYSDGNWIMVDLQARSNITEIRLNWEAAFGRSYRVELSDDNLTWRQVFSTTTGDGGLDVITIGQPARYARLALVSRATQWGFSLWEFAVMGSPLASTTLPAGIKATDIGAVGIPGSTTFTQSKYTLKGAGADIQGTSDAFHFVYGDLVGDGEVTARIESVTEADTWTKVGVMLRAGVAPGAVNTLMLVRPREGSDFQYRVAANGGTTSQWQDQPDRIESRDPPSPYLARYLKPSIWLKSVRVGNKVTSYSSDDGLCWSIRAQTFVPFETVTVNAGVALTSHNTSLLATASVSNLSIRQGVVANVNAQCPRAQVDGEIPAPSSTQWIVRPAVAGGSSWHLSTLNPGLRQRPASCIAEGAPNRRRWSDDEPDCPKSNSDAPWMTTGFAMDSNWRIDQPSPMGSADLGARTVVAGSDMWLRKEISLTSTDIQQLVFWGRWNNAVSIYLNGVLATNTYRSSMGHLYHYLGINDAARSALRVGTNTVAIRVSCRYVDENDKNRRVSCEQPFADVGIARHPTLSQLPVVDRVTQLGSVQAQLATIFADHTKEMGALGGTYGFRRGDLMAELHTLGWKNIAMNAPLASSPILRLASVDKRITEAVIAKLVNDGLLQLDSKVFGEVLTIQPQAGKPWGVGVRDITVNHLREHISGISHIGGEQGWKSEVAFRFGVTTEQINKDHLVQILASENTRFTPGLPPPTESRYENNAYFLLRYIAEKTVQRVMTKSLERYIAENMGVPDITLAYERLEKRHAREAGYAIVGKETRARWFELEEYLALSASAEGLTRFGLWYGPDFSRTGTTLTPKSGGQGGAMDGTRSHFGANLESREAEVAIWNSDMPGSNRYDDRRRIALDQLPEGSCDPRTQIGKPFRINSYWQSNLYLNMEPINQAPPALNSSVLGRSNRDDGGSWESAKWRFNPVTVGGQTFYTLQNKWMSDQFIHIRNGQLVSAPVAATDPAAHWVLRDSGSYFLIESRSEPGKVIHIENGIPAVGVLPEGFHSTRWYICN